MKASSYQTSNESKFLSNKVHPLTIMIAIPLALIGAIWSLLIAGKQQSLAAFMGIILLAGIVVKNSILLIDFIEMQKKQVLLHLRR